MQRTKRLIRYMIVSTLAVFFVACSSNKEVELTESNVTKYLNFEVISSSKGNNIIGHPVMEQTITITPVRDGTFNNTVIFMRCYGIDYNWEVLNSDPNIEQCTVEDFMEGKTYIKIELPTDGNYNKTIKCTGLSGLATVPESVRGNDLFDKNGNNEFSKAEIDFFEMFEEGMHVVTGTFVPN
ncbi:hypothetical protein [Pseudobutyrivibrio xylanivorans]|uniref:Lipoprotein n=1 Tax=Pseudobutyrivibrio xylanivorans TaxID=185007 RepID=A0A5P6VMD9_PSEXY|nr:hypothetical protein [Pseudobutyrivibrio xylanivorans]QFJ53528.1 hypothetical protein FXF36_00905 [Pseudobutyrivibrio xylanivorans]